MLRTILLAALALPILALALVGFRYLTRGTPVRAVRTLAARGGDVPAAREPMFRYTMELHSRVSLREGHQIEVLTSGDKTYPCLYDDMRAAKQSITLQMYYCQPGKVADEFQRILVDRARAGVRVLFLHDAFGSAPLPDEYFDAMRVAGVEVAVFRPVKWYSLEKAYNRSHIRVVVVDGMVGYTGGFGMDDKWLGDGRHDNQWRDTNVRFTGPATLDHQATFAAGWAEATGELLTGELFFPVEKHLRAAGGQLAAVLHSAPSVGSSVAERFLALSITGARQSLYITNAYFVPDDDFTDMLADAARRGVDVRVLTAGEHSDVKSTWYAGRAKFEALLTAGVRIYEYQPTMIHAKTLVVDGVWTSVGTMNFDNRSMSFNDETNLVSADEALGGRMTEVFLEDLKYAREISLEEFRRRPVTAKLLERGAGLVSRVL
jgi:cardiolipin synthase A/B